jgi:1-acyl-sn-glycerol-3-phosphate acyltransferase
MIDGIVANTARILCGCRARWIEPPVDTEPRVYYANHSSHLDALMIWASLPNSIRRRCRIVAAADYWLATRVRRWLANEVFHAIVIDRKNPSRSNNPIEAFVKSLNEGDSVVIFPEGTRGSGRELQAFRTGLWHIVRRRPTQAFVPVWLENLNRVLPKGEILPVPILSAVTFGRPIQRESNQRRDEFLDTLRDSLDKLREVNS